MGKHFSDLLDEELPYPLTGITQDLMLRRQEPRRAALGAGAFACSASEALRRQLRGLDLGLPREDRALLRDLSERVRHRGLPSVDFESDEVRSRRAEWAKIAPRGWSALSERAQCWAAIVPSALPEPLALNEAEITHAWWAAVATLHIALERELPASPAFIGALLHDLGRPYLRSIAEGLPHPPRATTVDQLADGLHPALGAVLVEFWGAASEVQLAVEHHHQPTPAIPIAVRPLAHAVRAGDVCAHALRHPGNEDLRRELSASLRPMDLNAGPILRDVRIALEEWQPELVPDTW